MLKTMQFSVLTVKFLHKKQVFFNHKVHEGTLRVIRKFCIPLRSWWSKYFGCACPVFFAGAMPRWDYQSYRT
jgi:hypothetical protein